MWSHIQLTVPVGDILVSDAGGNIEHDDTTLAINVIPITETSKLLLSCGIPDIEFDLAQVLRDVSKESGGRRSSESSTYCAETKRVNLDTEGSDVLLLEFSGQMALDEGGLSIH
jgi:hypothetical protein